MVAPRTPFDDLTRSRAEQSPAEAPHDESAHASTTEKNPFQPLFVQLNELYEFASYYLSARADLVRAHARRVVVRVLLGVIAAIVALCSVAAAVIFVLMGIAGGLAQLFGGRQWAGNLTTGALLLALAGVALWIVVPRALTAARRRMQDKYAHRRQAQRAAFGHDVHQPRAT